MLDNMITTDIVSNLDNNIISNYVDEYHKRKLKLMRSYRLYNKYIKQSLSKGEIPNLEMFVKEIENILLM